MNLKVNYVVSFTNNLLKISFEQTCINLFNDIVDRFFYWLFVNNDYTYDTSSSSSCKGRIEDNMLENFYVSLMEYSLLHKGLK